MDYRVLSDLRLKADVMNVQRGKTWFVLFSKAGFTEAVRKAAEEEENVILESLQELLEGTYK